MAEREFKLPDLGEGLTDGEVVRWLVAEGDAITLNQPIVEIETAKAVVEIPAPYAGTVVKLHAGEGSLEVGAPLISVDTGGSPGSGGWPSEVGPWPPPPVRPPYLTLSRSSRRPWSARGSASRLAGAGSVATPARPAARWPPRPPRPGRPPCAPRRPRRCAATRRTAGST